MSGVSSFVVAGIGAALVGVIYEASPRIGLALVALIVMALLLHAAANGTLKAG